MKKLKLRPPTYLTKKAKSDLLFQRDIDKLAELYEKREADVYNALSDAIFSMMEMIDIDEQDEEFERIFDLIENEVKEKIDIDELVGSVIFMDNYYDIEEFVAEECDKAIDLSKFKNAGGEE